MKNIKRADDLTRLPTPVKQNNINIQINKFRDLLQSELRKLIGKLDSDLFALRERKLDRSVLKELAKVKWKLQHIYGGVENKHPYISAQELIDYVSNRETESIFANIEYLVKYTLDMSRPQLGFHPAMKHMSFDTIEEIRKFAGELKNYINNNSLIAEPRRSILPPPPMRENPMADPDFLLGPEEKTKH